MDRIGAVHSTPQGNPANSMSEEKTSDVTSNSWSPRVAISVALLFYLLLIGLVVGGTELIKYLFH